MVTATGGVAVSATNPPLPKWPPEAPRAARLYRIAEALMRGRSLGDPVFERGRFALCLCILVQLRVTPGQRRLARRAYKTKLLQHVRHHVPDRYEALAVQVRAGASWLESDGLPAFAGVH
jgi:hypothetical protein